ncbi:helix-turn-helix domain-containing protein [Marinobacter zhejiangensis]|uniref:AraC family transcriptional regulator n=1 Tax=Marinobacter zhejiangensis TaxID=488535 RepID=A0A1I4LIV0_9GAMM|nr:AraC family transcriptional regulator [Marinobacter zhejiangensis]SFL90517.1 AraC family transcriptional regulator [Marinobacter zhejiangensis]
MNTDTPASQLGTAQTTPQRHDIAETLQAAGVAPKRVLELGQGRTLAHWQNRKGLIHYEKPNHHALSIYTQRGDKAARVVDGQAVSHGFPGAACLFPAGSQSTWLIDGPFEFFHLYFSDRDIARCAAETWDCEPDRVRLSELYHGNDPLLAQAGQLLSLSDWQAAGQTMAMDHLAQWLLLQIVSRHSTVQKATPELTGQLSQRYQRLLQERIDAELDQPLTLADMASWVNLSPYHFARLFRASFGCAPYQYVLEQRLIRARQLLRQPTSKITAVALACGFNDHSQFSRAFRKRYGVTPSGFRATSGLVD